MTDLRYELRHPKESFHNTSITMDVDQCTIVTLHGKPMFTKVCFLMSLPKEQSTYRPMSFFQVYTEGRLIVEFTFDDMMRIRSWHFTVRNHRELIPRSILAMQQVCTMKWPEDFRVALLSNLESDSNNKDAYHYFQDPGMVESLSKNVTRQGMTSTTLNYLRVRTTNQYESFY